MVWLAQLPQAERLTPIVLAMALAVQMAAILPEEAPRTLGFWVVPAEPVAVDWIPQTLLVPVVVVGVTTSGGQVEKGLAVLPPAVLERQDLIIHFGYIRDMLAAEEQVPQPARVDRGAMADLVLAEVVAELRAMDLAPAQERLAAMGL